MYPVPAVKNIVKTREYLVVERFLKSEYWRPEFDGLFHEGIRVEKPHAVPGMLQAMTACEWYAHRYWLANTVKSKALTAEPVIIPTTDPAAFWALYEWTGDVRWAERDGVFTCECCDLLRVEGGQIVFLRQYENPISYYKAIGVELPLFDYDPRPLEMAALARMPAGTASKYSPRQNRELVIENFTNPITAESDEPVFSNGVTEVCAFAPHSMPVSFSGREFDQQMDWVGRVTLEWHTVGAPSVYFGADPDIVLVESTGFGATAWSHHNGHYTQREVNLAFLDETGKIGQFRCYFNSLNKFSSMNLSIPSFPYFNF